MTNMESFGMEEDKPYADIGGRIRTARESTGASQTDMTRALGLAEPTYGNYERGSRRMPPHVMEKFVRITGYKSDWLYLGIGPQKDEKGDELYHLLDIASQKFKDDPFMSPLLQAMRAHVKKKDGDN